MAGELRERRVHLSSGRYRYLEGGTPGRTPLVLLHGRSSLAETWLPVIEPLLDRWHVLVLEQRGHGASPWDAEGRYNLADFLTDLEEFVEVVLEGRRHGLIGHSMGSCTSIVYAGRHPERVLGLVLEDGGPLGPTVIETVQSDHDATPESFASWDAARADVLRTHPHLESDALDARTDLMVRPGPGGGYSWCNDVLRLLSPRHFDELMETGMWEAIPHLTMPTQFLWATTPYLVEPDVVTRMVEMNPGIERVDMPTGHSIHEERPDLFLAAILPFLEQNLGVHR